MKKILILYFSGAGATKKVAECMHARLSQHCEAELFSVESKDMPSMDGYDSLIIGTPTHHAAPAKSIMNYLNTMPRLIQKAPVFIFNTRGLYALNTNRILAKQLRKKNMITIMDRAYRSPASDGSLIAPFVKRFFAFEKGLEKKINRDCAHFLALLNKDASRGYIPRFRFGSIFNAPNKAAGQLVTAKIYLHKDKCVKCHQCIHQCAHKIVSTDHDGYPLIASQGCENCYRCIHHCPKAALSLSKRRAPKKLLRYSGRAHVLDSPPIEYVE